MPEALTEEFRRCEAGLCFQCRLYGRKDCQIVARDQEIVALRAALADAQERLAADWTSKTTPGVAPC